jgi:2,3-bisphosphoglycerate-dependent phosphoglycerate mutase
MARHGESTGNLAREAAWAARAEVIDVPERDPDVPLSPVGRMQAAALGEWIAALPEDRRPTLVASSPYVRTMDTVRIALGAEPGYVDERLRDRELGILDRLTVEGVAARFPDEAARKQRLGKFYYRPPGGESWADVALRLRAVLTDLGRENPDGRVLVMAHDAIVVLARYIVERLSEHELLDIERTLVANASVTVWSRTDGALTLETFNNVEHLDHLGVPAT